MFQVINWKFTKGFNVELLTKSLTKQEGLAEQWNARAFSNLLFDFVPNMALKVFHNANEVELTDYAFGLAPDNTSGTESNNFLDPSDLPFGIYFTDGTALFIDGSSYCGVASAENAEYWLRFDSTMRAEYWVGSPYADGTKLATSNGTFAGPAFRLFAMSKQNYQTTIEAQFNPDGIERANITAVEYTDASGFTVNILQSALNVPIRAWRLRVYGSNFSEDTVDSTHVKLFRIVDALEDPNDFGLPSWESQKELTSADGVNIVYYGVADYFDVIMPTLESYEKYALYLGYADKPLKTIGGEEYNQIMPVFSTEYIQSTEDSSTAYKQYFNDVYYKMRNMDILIDVDRLFTEAPDVFNFSMRVSQYMPDDKVYDTVQDERKIAAGETDTARVIDVDNASTIQDLFVKQYMPEYVTYFDDMRKNRVLVESATNIDDFQLLLLKNITMMNYFKGNRRQMEFLISVFSATIGYHLYYVTPDPYYNFIYRVTTTMPKRFWLNDIKPITHPLGWGDFYVEVPEAPGGVQIKVYDEDYFVKYYKLPKQTYIDVAKYNEGGETVMWGLHHGNAALSDYNSEKEFPFHPTDYSAHVEYHNEQAFDETASGLYHELRTRYPDTTAAMGTKFDRFQQRSYFSYTADWREGGRKYDIRFGKPGVCTEYIWEVFKGNAHHMTVRTLVPRLRIDVSRVGGDFHVLLKLKHKDWVSQVFCFDLKDDHYARFDDSLRLPTHLEVVYDSSTTFQHEFMCFDNYSTWYMCGAQPGIVDSTVDGSYMEAARIGHTFSLDSSSSVGSETTVVVSASYIDPTFDKNVLAGLFTEHEWLLFSGPGPAGSVINTFRTPKPSITLTFLSSEVGTSHLRYVGIRGDDRYEGTQYITI